MIFVVSAITTLVCSFFTFVLIRRETRIFYSVFLFSHVYFGIAGPVYWSIVHDNYFLSKQWVGSENTTVIFFLTVFLLTSFLLIALKGPRPLHLNMTSSTPPAGTQDRWTWAIWFIGWISMAYVLARGASQIGGTAVTADRDPILLILYQFTDILIAILIYRISRSGITPRVALNVAAFVVAAVIIGLRYKIALLLIPLLLRFMLTKRSTLKKLGAAIGAVAVLALFSYMTINRRKFSGLSMDGLDSFGFENFLYGFFAESNIIFGALAILEAFRDFSDYVFLTPVFDTLFEFVPRALYPAKAVGAYIAPMYIALGGGTEAFLSGTTYPFFCEFYMMGGSVGLIAGLLLYVKLYYWLERSIVRNSGTHQQMILGLCLLATFFGYYYYSRGYTPQAAKGLAFIILPFIWFLRREYRSRIKHIAPPVARTQFSG